MLALRSWTTRIESCLSDIVASFAYQDISFAEATGRIQRKRLSCWSGTSMASCGYTQVMKRYLTLMDTVLSPVDSRTLSFEVRLPYLLGHHKLIHSRW